MHLKHFDSTLNNGVSMCSPCQAPPLILQSTLPCCSPTIASWLWICHTGDTCLMDIKQTQRRLAQCLCFLRYVVWVGCGYGGVYNGVYMVVCCVHVVVVYVCQLWVCVWCCVAYISPYQPTLNNNMNDNTHPSSPPTPPTPPPSSSPDHALPLGRNHRHHRL